MLLVYIGAPLGAGPDRDKNIQRALDWVAWAGEKGVIPIAPWVSLAQRWAEDKRDLGIAIDLALVPRCDELWLCGEVVSPGMRLEAECARQNRVPVFAVRTMGPTIYRVPYAFEVDT
jgi:hypothetical protein